MLYIADVVKLLEPLKEMMHTELTHKLTATDAVLKDSISKLVRSKVTVTLLPNQLHICEQYRRAMLDLRVLL